MSPHTKTMCSTSSANKSSDAWAGESAPWFRSLSSVLALQRPLDGTWGWGLLPTLRGPLSSPFPPSFLSSLEIVSPQLWAKGREKGPLCPHGNISGPHINSNKMIHTGVQSYKAVSYPGLRILSREGEWAFTGYPGATSGTCPLYVCLRSRHAHPHPSLVNNLLPRWEAPL